MVHMLVCLVCVGVESLMGGGAVEGPAIGAGAVVSVAASASADVTAASTDVVSTSVDVAADCCLLYYC
ncbi:unnamed protein product [Closterium sp. NIES-54]